jgi:CheY-like chemotaxis protein
MRLPVLAFAGTSKASRAADEDHGTIPPLRILVADDNRDGADSCATLLQLSGHTVVTAYNGAQAFAVAEEFRPEVALLDIGMPELNGYDVAQKIRSESWARAPVLVAITGWGQEEDRRRAIAAGFDHHLAKPLDPVELNALLLGIGAHRQRNI